MPKAAPLQRFRNDRSPERTSRGIPPNPAELGRDWRALGRALPTIRYTACHRGVPCTAIALRTCAAVSRGRKRASHARAGPSGAIPRGPATRTAAGRRKASAGGRNRVRVPPTNGRTDQGAGVAVGPIRPTPATRYRPERTAQDGAIRRSPSSDGWSSVAIGWAGTGSATRIAAGEETSGTTS
jgi:hypothetical protein